MPKEFNLARSTVVDADGKRHISLSNQGVASGDVAGLLLTMSRDLSETLDLTRNNLTDRAVENLAKFTVKRLILRNNSIRDARALLGKFEDLDLTDNPLNDETLFAIVRLPEKTRQKIHFSMPEDAERLAKLKAVMLQQDAAALTKLGKFSPSAGAPSNAADGHSIIIADTPPFFGKTTGLGS